ncbi:hypothetical protein [Nocardioides sp.]|uniref:hypothetical protein n=1 Tax=Nocardioides sp. TaxID=35761 RepID=UPI00356277B8
MTSLHERLADLAEDARPGAPTQDVWERGRRWHRRRQTGSLAIVAAMFLACVGLGWQAWDRSATHDAVLPAGSRAALPDRVWTPSPTLPGTDSVGPLGRVAIVVMAERAGWFGSELRPLAISAESGNYAFLDLPRWGTDAALSPDGGHVAYWRAGTPSGSPPAEGEAITGFAVYDTATGEVRGQEVPTVHGLTPDRLVWADGVTLVAEFGQLMGGRGDSDMDQSSSRSAPLWVWNLDESGAVVDQRLTDAGVNGIEGGGHGLLWWSADQGGFHVVDVDRPQDGVRTIDLESGSGAYVAAVDASGLRAANVPGNKNPSSVAWASATTSQVRVRGTSRTFRVLAWLDETRLLIVRGADDALSHEGYRPGLAIVDVQTGGPVEVTRGDQLTLLGDNHVAWELATEPTFDAVEPPTPVDRRVWLALGLSVVVLGGTSLAQWRRRVVA